METFSWCIRPTLKVESQPKVDKVQFGDGYTQRQASGINNLLHTYPVEVKVHNKERFSVEHFLAKHQGVQPFKFFDPYSRQLKSVICSKWTASMDRHYTTFSCEFEEVPV